MLSLLALGVLLAGGSVIDLDGTLFVQMGIFFIAFFILKSLVVRPVMGVIDARDKASDGAKAEAQRMEEEAAQKREHFEGELRKVAAMANEERDRLREQAQRLARKLTEDARHQAAKTQATAKAQLDAQASVVRREALTQVPALAHEITSKLLGRSVQ